MKRSIAILLSVLAIILPASAQKRVEAYLQTDLTSAYLWRGQKNAGVSLQPVAGLRWRGFNLYAWGNIQLAPPSGQPDKHEIDLFLKYTFLKNYTVGLKNVYVNTRGHGFLSYGSIPHAANGLDVLLACDFKFINAEWTTTIAGYDGYNHSGKRSYGSYLSINAPFSLLWFDWVANVGIVPYYCSRYSEDASNGFHVNACSLKISHTFNFCKSTIGLTPYAMLLVNPSSRKAYFQIGARFLFDPSKKKVAAPAE